MAFFEEIGKKITQTGQGAVQKTKSMTETIKLNGLISEEEKKISDFILQIGRVYFEKHENDSEPEFFGFISGIQEARAKMKTYSEQIKQIKGIVKCFKCGGDVTYTAPFCPSCGNSMGQTPQATSFETSVQCSNCGRIILEGKAFCSSCGRKIND